MKKLIIVFVLPYQLTPYTFQVIYHHNYSIAN